MEYTVLGRTGFKVSRLGLGGSQLEEDYAGNPLTDKEAAEMIDTALELGINFIDTAPSYGLESEKRIGRALQGRRDRVIVATKAVIRGQPYSYGNTLQCVEGSLLRLQTDYIDLLQVHEAERTTFDEVMNETVPALLKLKAEGKVRAIGINSMDLSLLSGYMQTGLFDTIQFFLRYMLIDHTAKDEVLPLARRLNVGVINGSVLGMGILAGQPADFLHRHRAILAEASKRMEQLAFLCKPDGEGLIEPALRFSLACPDIAVTLSSAGSPRLLRQNAGYCDGAGLTAAELNRVYALFRGQRLF